MIDYVFDIGIVRRGDGEPAGTLASIVPVFSSWYFPHFHLANSQTHLVVAKQSRVLVTRVNLRVPSKALDGISVCACISGRGVNGIDSRTYRLSVGLRYSKSLKSSKPILNSDLLTGDTAIQLLRVL